MVNQNSFLIEEFVMEASPLFMERNTRDSLEDFVLQDSLHPDQIGTEASRKPSPFCVQQKGEGGLGTERRTYFRRVFLFTNVWAVLVILSSVGFAQQPATGGGTGQPVDPRADLVKTRKEDRARFLKAERDGVEVRIKDIARFRGVRVNQLVGYGLIIGLDGTGDTKKTPFTTTLMANALKAWGTMVDTRQFDPKNVAAVAITAELPPFSSPGNRIDVTVQSIGDAKSLQGGFLLQSPIFGAGDPQTAIAVAQGPVSIGGFNFGQGGNSVQKNHVTIGRIPGGAIVEQFISTKIVFDGKLYLEMDTADFTTANRLVEALKKNLAKYEPLALDPGTIQLSLPLGMTPVAAMAEIEATTVYADIPAVVVINERTGTIVIGGNVRVGVAVIAHGSLSVRIEEEPIISQPAPFSSTGTTTTAPLTTVNAEEQPTQISTIKPNTTVADLAKLLQVLNLSPRDIISIFQALQDQGALKARIKVQ